MKGNIYILANVFKLYEASFSKTSASIVSLVQSVVWLEVDEDTRPTQIM